MDVWQEYQRLTAPRRPARQNMLPLGYRRHSPNPTGPAVDLTHRSQQLFQSAFLTSQLWRFLPFLTEVPIWPACLSSRPCIQIIIIILIIYSSQKEFIEQLCIHVLASDAREGTSLTHPHEESDNNQIVRISSVAPQLGCFWYQ